MGAPGAHGPRPDSCQAGRRETTASARPEGARAAVTSAPGGTPRDQPSIWSGHDPETAARGDRRIRGLQTSGADNAAASDAGYCCIYHVYYAPPHSPNMTPHNGGHYKLSGHNDPQATL